MRAPLHDAEWTREYVANPFVRWRGGGARTTLVVPRAGVELRARSQLRALVEHFRQPAPLARVREAGADDEVAAFLVHHLVLLPADEAGFLARGLVHPAEQPVGRPLAWHDLHSLDGPGVAVLGVPLDFAGESPVRGSGLAAIRGELGYLGCAAAGPGEDVVLDLELGREIPARELRIFDLGDVLAEPERDDLRTAGRRVRKVVGGVLDRGLFPLAFGGDHTLTHFVLEEVFDRFGAVGVIQFDAHPDLYFSPDEQPDDLGHANVFHHVRRRGELAVLLQLGVRGVQRTGPRSRRVQDARIEYRSALDLRTAAPERVFEHLPRDIPYYLSFDVDVLDPSVAPETGVPVPGGLSFHQALLLVDHASRSLPLVGADFVEVGGTLQPRNAAAEAAARLAATLILNRHATRPLQGHVFGPHG